MPGHYHAVVWIDHGRPASSISTPRMRTRSSSTRASGARLSSQGRSGPAITIAEDQAFLEEVTRAIADAGAILVVGPSNEKDELVKYIVEKAHPR